MGDRAVVFIDGNNWYHLLRGANVPQLGKLDYAKISSKLLGPAREWRETRYYIGRVKQAGNLALYADQRAFIARLEALDTRITTHFGRLEERTVENPLAFRLEQYLHGLKVRIDKGVFQELLRLAQSNKRATVSVEKAVDVMIAVDMVLMGERDEYDVAYLLSADGDSTEAVKAIRSHGKKVYAASAGYGAQLAQACNTFIRLDRAWFADCYV